MENVNVVDSNNVVGAGVFTQLAADLVGLGKDASQLQLEAVLKDTSIAQIIGLDNAGTRLSGSAERALAARINMMLPLGELDDGMFAKYHWSMVEYRDKGELAKKLAPVKKECFDLWDGHSNPSTKWARVRAYGYELAYPKTTGDVVDATEGEEGEEGAAGTSSRTRDLYERSVVELGKLYRALTSADNDAIIKAHAKRDELTAALEHITRALEALEAPLEDEDLRDFMTQVTKR